MEVGADFDGPASLEADDDERGGVEEAVVEGEVGDKTGLDEVGLVVDKSPLYESIDNNLIPSFISCIRAVSVPVSDPTTEIGFVSGAS